MNAYYAQGFQCMGWRQLSNWGRGVWLQDSKRREALRALRGLPQRGLGPGWRVGM